MVEVLEQAGGRIDADQICDAVQEGGSRQTKVAVSVLLKDDLVGGDRLGIQVGIGVRSVVQLVNGRGAERAAVQELQRCLLHRSVNDCGPRVRVPTECLILISANRSEEHTSELQSRLHLVCRLLLEK